MHPLTVSQVCSLQSRRPHSTSGRRSKMRVNLTGIHTTYKKLASGETKKYYYAWKGGPRIDAVPRTTEFIRLYNEAVSVRKERPGGTMRALIDYFRDSGEFKGGSPHSRRSYERYLKLIDARYGTMPLAALEDKRARGEFKTFRGTFAATPRKADYVWTTLARVLSVAKDHGKINVNVCERGGRLYQADRSDIIWQASDIHEFCGVASVELQAALLLALWTGQRQGDLLKLSWRNYNGSYIRLRQTKAKGGKGRRVIIPVGGPLKLALDAALKQKRSAVTILTNSRGLPWTEDGFRTSWGKAFDKTNLGDLHFHDLRGTAVTRLALSGCTVPEIASITGHAMETVQAILDAHYLGGRVELAESAIKKLNAVYG
jgi:integrase